MIHETGEQDYENGGGYLFFKDNEKTKDALLNRFSGNLLAKLEQGGGAGIWDTNNYATWSNGVLNSKLTWDGTAAADRVGDSRLEYFIVKVPYTDTYVYVGTDNGFRVDATSLRATAGRHPNLETTTPELKPFLTNVIMRQELKGFDPEMHETVRTVEDSQKNMDEGRSGLLKASNSKHIDKGRGADAADVTSERNDWGEAKGTKKSAKKYFKAQRESFGEAQKEYGSRGDRFTSGADWTKPYDPGHIENSERVLPDPVTIE